MTAAIATSSWRYSSLKRTVLFLEKQTVAIRPGLMEDSRLEVYISIATTLRWTLSLNGMSGMFLSDEQGVPGYRRSAEMDLDPSEIG